MNPADLCREAIASLQAHRLRSVLSLVGVAGGVATIVSALAFARGAERRAVEEFAALGIDNVVVRAAAERSAAPILTLDHAGTLARQFPGAIVSAVRTVGDDAVAGSRRVTASIAGVTASWRVTGGLAIARGRWFTAGDPAARTAVLSTAIAVELFGEDDPIGERVLAAGEWRTVIGLIAHPGLAAATGSAVRTFDLDRAIFVPAAAMDLSLGPGDAGTAVNEIVVRTTAAATPERIRAWVTSTLGDDARLVEIIVPRELVQSRLRAARRFHALLVAIGVLALAISGAGIMNIMVASVSERASEIGLRRALGARRSAITRQIAIEAGVVGSLGGMIGIVVGLAAAVTTARVADWPVAVAGDSLLIAFALALGVGLAASIYPARLAAAMSPAQLTNHN